MNYALSHPPRFFLPFDESEQRFRRIVRRMLIVFVVVSVVVPWLPVFELDRQKQEEVPVRIARVLLEKKQPPPPPPPPKPAEPMKIEEAPKPEKKPEPTKKQADQKPKQEVNVREKVAKIGLLAMRNELAELRNTPVIESLKNQKTTLTQSAKEQTRLDKVPLTDSVMKGSGGIDTSHLKNDIAKTSLTERAMSTVQSKLAISGRGGDGKERSNARTNEEIQLVLERYKGSFNLLYTKQLRIDSSLRGKVLFELTIAPSGEVVACRVLQSELGSPELEQKFVTKLRSIDFGEKEVDTTVIRYPLDFFPS